MLAFLGKLHLLLLHLPIGLLVFSFAMEWLGKWRQMPAWRDAGRLTSGFSAASAVVAATCGWLLARSGGYEADTVQIHQWTGMGTALLAVATWWVRKSDYYTWLLSGTTIVMAIAAHYGGTLTHGADFLWPKETASAADTEIQQFSPESLVYQDVIQPILKKKCISCHNPDKKKGELMLDTKAHILQGGENGKVWVAGKPDESLILKRAMLPLHDDDHMPPAGKAQLTESEIALLRWWIEQDSAWSKRIADMKTPDNIQKILSGQATLSNPVLKMDIKPASASAIAAARQAGISILAEGAESALLQVSLAGNKTLNSTILQKIKPLSEQIFSLDLSNTNTDDALFASLPKLPHLTRLNVSKTAVTDAVLKSAVSWPYLEYLNITNTVVTDAGLSNLKELPCLRSVYTWQSKVTEAGIQALQSRYPKAVVNSGARTDSASAPLALRSPKILYIRNIFEDTVKVDFDFPKTVKVYYAFDEASPTTQSIPYDGTPLILSNSAKVKAFSGKDGWANSPLVEASFVKRKYKIKEATLQNPPSPKYPGAGANSLRDGKIADNHLDPNYLGYEGEDMKAVLDLGEAVPVSRVSLHCIENNNSWIFAPRGLLVWVSMDGKKWEPVIQKTYPVNTSMQPTQTHILSEQVTKPATCRYLKVQVQNVTKNPAWHPGAGQKCWVFVDEILVE